MERGMEPTWIKNFEVFAQTARVLNLSGNIDDIYVCKTETDYNYCDLKDWLHRKLESATAELFYYSPVHGLCDWGMLQNPEETSEAVKEFIRQGKGNAKDLPALATLLESICRKPGREKSFTIVFPSASRLVVNSRALSEAEHKAFTVLLEAVKESMKQDRLIFLTENLCDLPDFMTREGADIRNIQITLPEQVQRKQYLAKLFPEFTPKDRDRLADAADNMNICEIQRMTALIAGRPDMKNVQGAIEQYKYGYKDNPWMDMDCEKVLDLKNYLSERVFGQDEAVEKVSRMMVKAQTGVKKAFNSKKNRRPVGVCFMVGPTGTGKTFIAKKTAEYVFGSEDAMIRFDMAEYMQPHAAERLKGAPPGYVGYAEGGQLTNAVKAKPHAIILFDEIEKAHPDVLTLLLGVLEDGVLTSGKGENVSFANTFLIFTSNLGAAEASRAADDEEAKAIILNAIHRHFYENIGRPEILGRFQRDNAITVFNRLGPEVTEGIVASELKQAQENFKTQSNIELTWTPEVIRLICEKAAENLEANGRAVLAAMDKYFEDPLADLFAEERITRNVRIEIREIREDENGAKLVCQVSEIAPPEPEPMPQTTDPAWERTGMEPMPGIRPLPIPGTEPEPIVVGPLPNPGPGARPLKTIQPQGGTGDPAARNRRPIVRLS